MAKARLNRYASEFAGCLSVTCVAARSPRFSVARPCRVTFFMEGKTMGIYRELYYKLFGAAADAVESLERNEPVAAKDILVAAMREAEETVISQEDCPSRAE